MLNELRVDNLHRIIFAHININSWRNKFDILGISETKLNDSFPASNFIIEGFALPFRLDRTENYIY